MEVEEAVALAPEIDRRPEMAVRVRSRALIIWAVAIFAVLSGYCGIRSQGFISGDACIHYFAARFAFENPKNFVDVWNRPLVTALYAGPAWIGGREGIRIVSTLVAIGCGIVAWRIARGQGLKLSALALIFTLGQPLLFLHSFSEMTELPFALVLGLAFWAWQEKRFWLAAIIVSWTPLARPEGFGMVMLAFVGLLFIRKWKQVVVLPVPVLLWDVAGWLLSDRTRPWWRWLKDSWIYSTESLYGHGNVLNFVMLLPLVISPLVLPAMVVGSWLSLTNRQSKKMAHCRLCIALTAALPLFVLMVHSVLYWKGKMASSGEPRYLIVVAPFWGVLAARGWEWVFSRFRWRRAIGWATAAVSLPVIVNVISPVVPVPFWHDWESARQIVTWYESSPLRATCPKVTTSHPGIYYFLDVNPYRSPRVTAWGRDLLTEMPNDTLLIWDPVFGNKNACAALALDLDEIRKAGWVEVPIPVLQEDGDISAKGRATKNDPENRWHVFMNRSAP